MFTLRTSLYQYGNWFIKAKQGDQVSIWLYDI